MLEPNLNMFFSKAKEPPLLQNPAERLLSLLETDSPRIFVGMAGLPGSGKTTLAAHLGEAINRCAGSGTMTVLSMDGFHLSKAQLNQFPQPEEAFRRRGAPWTFDVDKLASRLRDVRQSVGRASAWWPDFQHEAGDPVEDVHEISPTTRLVLVEGLYLLYGAGGWAQVREQFDELWYLDTPLETTMERLTERHMRSWKITREEAKHRIASNDQLNGQIVLNTRFSANWWVLSD